MAQRFYGNKDLATFEKFNRELIGEPNIIDFNYDDFGPDNKQNVSFAFQRAYLVEVDLKPDIGDILKWNEGYFEVDSYNENQLIGGDPTKSHSIVVQAHLTRMPTTNLEEYRGF
jgi:hypothetical protein